ncbi:MAG: hypothetical protein HGB10_09040 [Coriobacteriia bacterium]|nr:hypothetical protein [Coriobacteriia bacterium]
MPHRVHGGFIRQRRLRAVAAFISVVILPLSLAACKSKDQAIVESTTSPVATGTVQAQPLVDPSTIAVPELPADTQSLSPAAASANPQESADSFAEAIAPDPAKPNTFWPKRVGDFAARFAGPVWYPKHLPVGYKFESLDIVEFDPGSGLVCDIVFTSGEKVLQFTQGSPKNRDYEIVSAGKLAWGSGTANLVHMDPADKSTPIIAVYSKGGSFAELTGDVSTAELKAVAASMVSVK